MTAKVSSLLNVDLRGGRYIFMLIAWNDYYNAVREELDRQVEAFGLDLAEAGTIVQPFNQRMFEVGQEVVDKPWPPEIKLRMVEDPEPIILILDHAWSTFDPHEHAYGVIWLSDYREDVGGILRLLQQLAMRTRRGEDLMEYLRDAAERQRRHELTEHAEATAGAVARVASYVEVRPSIFGISIDLKAILRDIATRGTR